MRGLILSAFLIALSCKAPTPAGPVIRASLSADCAIVGDDTGMVQAHMSAGTCLPAGTYRVDMPALNAVGRRRDAMLAGGTLCGTRADTAVLFRGDAHALFWVGVANADVHDVRLDSSCVTNTAEQAHLIRLTEGHAIRDAVLVHPPRSPKAGDDVNVVGSMAQPMIGLVIDHVEFASCARFGVQISRGASGARISNSTFSGGCAFGSEGSGAIDGLVIDHVTFAGTQGLGLNVQRQTNLRVSHVTMTGRTILLYYCDHCALDHVRVSDVRADTAGDFVSAVTIADVAHDVRLSDVTLEQATGVSAPIVTVGPLRSNRQADLSGIVIERASLVQSTAAPVVLVQGTAGFTLAGSTVTYDGPSGYDAHAVVAGSSVASSPAVSVPSTDVVQSDDVLVGCTP